jgi:hypothetical protein
MRLGVTLALLGVENLALLTDDPAPGVVEAADLLSDAADFLSQSAGGQP